jgi:hypothetical protein
VGEGAEKGLSRREGCWRPDLHLLLHSKEELHSPHLDQGRTYFCSELPGNLIQLLICAIG